MIKNKNNNNMKIIFTFFNEHSNHKGKEVTISNNEIITKTEMNDLAIKLIRNNIMRVI